MFMLPPKLPADKLSKLIFGISVFFQTFDNSHSVFLSYVQFQWLRTLQLNKIFYKHLSQKTEKVFLLILHLITSCLYIQTTYYPFQV